MLNNSTSIENVEVAILPITYNCNAKCIMCSIGDSKNNNEITLEEYEKLFSDSVWSNNIFSVNITGGEPFLRKDIYEVTEKLIYHTKNIKSIVANTNAMLGEKIVFYIEKIMPLIEDKNIAFTIYISLDGIGDNHDKVRNVDGCFELVDKTIKKLRELKKIYNFNIVLNCTITNDNYLNVYEVYEYAKEHELEINYTYAMVSTIYFNNKSKLNDLEEEKRKYIIKFFIMFIKTSAGIKMSGYYRCLIKMLQGKKRCIGCVFKNKGVFININGDVYKCWVFEKKIGSLKESSFSEIWTKQHQNYPVAELSNKCENCFNNCYQEYSRLIALEKMFE